MNQLQKPYCARETAQRQESPNHQYMTTAEKAKESDSDQGTTSATGVAKVITNQKPTRNTSNMID